MGIGEIEIDKEIVSIFFLFLCLAKSKQTARIERERETGELNRINYRNYNGSSLCERRINETVLSHQVSAYLYALIPPPFTV